MSSHIPPAATSKTNDDIGQVCLYSCTDSSAHLDATVLPRRVLQLRANHHDSLAQVCARTAVLFVQRRAAVVGVVSAATTKPATSRDISARGRKLALALLRSRPRRHRRRRRHASHRVWAEHHRVAAHHGRPPAALGRGMGGRV